MLRSVYLKTLRDLRWGILGWGAGLGALLVFFGVAFVRAYPDEASRQELVKQIQGGLSAAQVFYGPPRGIDSLGGFVEWRLLGLTPVLLGVYLILSATAMTRGAEESHVIEPVAATPTTRARLLVEQWAALTTGLVLACALIGVGALAVGPITGEPVLRVPRIAGECANVAAATLLFGSLGLLAAQLFDRRRTAALTAAAVMIVIHLANTLPLAVSGLSWLRLVSPLYLYTRSSSLADGHLDWPALASLFAVAIAVAALALAVSGRRDLFDTFHARRQPAAAPDEHASGGRAGAAPGRFLGNGFGRGLADASVAIVSWAVGLGALAVIFTALVPNMRTALMDNPSGAFARFSGLFTERALLSALLYSFLLPPLVCVFGVTLAASWAGDEMDQRLELELTAPVPRRRAILQRLGAATASQTIVLAAVAAAIAVTIEIGHVDVPLERVGAASGALLALAVCAAAMAFAIASWRPAVAAAAAGAVITVSFFADLVIPLLGMPFWVRYLTIFGLFGAPLAHGVVAWRVGALAAMAVAFAVASAAGFQRRDIEK